MPNRPRINLGAPRAVPAGWPPDVAPHQLITAAHINAVKASVYQWPGDVNAGGFALLNAGFVTATNVQLTFGQPALIMKAAGGATDQKTWRQYISNNDGSSFTADVINDAFGAATPWLQVIRAGMSITSVSLPNGNVGIGTASPLAKLDITSGSKPVSGIASNAGAFRIASDPWTSAPTLLMGVDSGASVSWIQAQQPGVQTNSLALNPDGGKVGIGTANPGLRLHIDAPGGSPATSGTTQTGHFRLSPQGGGHCLDFGVYPGYPFGPWLQATNLMDLSVSYPIILQPNGGNVGIGKSNPGSRLAVSGLPASSAGLTSGDIWYDSAAGNVLKIVP